MKIKTAGDLRGFLAGVLTDIQAGHIDAAQAAAIAKVASQINQSLAVEVKTALELQKMGKDQPVAGSMAITSVQPEDRWCDQCDAVITPDVAAGCKSNFCSLRQKIGG